MNLTCESNNKKNYQASIKIIIFHFIFGKSFVELPKEK